jgi:hypothetical protein
MPADKVMRARQNAFPFEAWLCFHHHEARNGMEKRSERDFEILDELPNFTPKKRNFSLSCELHTW